jgi:hypothetical protein
MEKVGTPNHSPLREYFRTRDSVVLIREYLGRETRWLLKYLWAWLKSVIFIFLFEKSESKNSQALFGAASMGFLGRFDLLGRMTPVRQLILKAGKPTEFFGQGMIASMAHPWFGFWVLR